MAAARLCVLHAYKTYLPETEGGIPAAIRSLAAMPECESLVLATRAPLAPRRILVDGVPVERAAAFGEALSLPLAPLFPLALRRAAQRADVIALHTPFPLGDLGALLAPGVPLVVHWHADIVRQRRAARLVAPLIRRTLARAARIVVSHPGIVADSPWLAQFAAKCDVVPYGVDAEAWAALTPGEAEEAASLRARHPRLVAALGRLVPYKGFDVLVEAMASVDGTVMIVGEGPERARLSARIAALGLGGRVLLAGRRPRSSVRALLHAARAFAFPSVSPAEAFGIAQLEAMACGLPVVNTALPTAVPWVARDGAEALTVAPGDPAALAAALTALLDDPERAAALGTAGRARVRAEFTEAAYRERTRQIWRDAAASRPPAA
ncbi:MAG: glycosyltransferase [Acetobacteraceae bacterium]